MTAAHKAAKAWYDAIPVNADFKPKIDRQELIDDMVRRLTGHLEPYFKAELNPLIEALAVMVEEYANQQSQYGSEYIWTKYEDRDAIEKALRTLELYAQNH